MATSSALQTTGNFGVVSWNAVYEAVNNPLLSSYDYETIRQSMINYLQQQNPENFNDYLQNSELIALINLIAFMGQAMSYRFDLNARETFMPTAQTRNAINYLAGMVNYVPSRNIAANGYLKINSISVNDNVFDSLGNNLNGLGINWNDSTNRNWQDQWNSIINAVLVNSQSIGSPGNSQVINGIDYSEYSLSCPNGQTSPYPFTAAIDNASMNFEIVNPTSVGQTYIYEVDPYDSGASFNLLFENDGQGYNSINTGFFLYFKQGSLSHQTLTFTNALPNSVFTLNATGVNNSDIWLYKVNSDGSFTPWTMVPAIYGESTEFNNIPSAQQNIYSVTNGANDTVTLVFGDGVFGTIPQGNFVVFTRSSNGLTYRINPSELSNVTLNIPYNSKANRTQLLTVRATLQYTVGNSAPTESLANIKLKAPQSFYSQNRMVNGQDYNSFPFTQYSSILEVKAVNRTSSGVSRYLDVVDPTGKYSSTNIFCNDGFMYLDDSIITNNYSYTNLNTLASLIETQIAAIIASSSTLSFILNPSNYPPFTLPLAPLATYNNTFGPSTQWNMTLTNSTSSSGWIGDISAESVLNQILTINDNSFIPPSGSTSILVPGALLQFVPPPGMLFDANNNTVPSSTGIPNLNQKTSIYAVINSTVNAGLGNNVTMDGQNVDGSGAILLNQKVPNGALLAAIFPYYSPVLPSNVNAQLIQYLISGTAVALQYFPSNIGTGFPLWVLDTTLPAGYNPNVYGTQFVDPEPPSLGPVANNWILAFVPSPSTPSNFVVYQRSNAYYFGSQKQTSFYYDAVAKIYDPINATTLTDSIVILSTNGAPGTNNNIGLPNDIPVEISGTVNEINGTIDNSRVAIQYADLTSSGVPSNPTFFTDCVGFGTSYIFFVTNNSLSTTTLIPSGPNGVVIVDRPSTINNNIYFYANGAIIFCISNLTFYQISRNGSVATKALLNNPGDTLTYSYFTGRQNLKFQYQHNAADNRRIDPSPANIIDIYCLEASYASAYQLWVVDTTGQLAKPTPPTTETLSNDFSALNNYKMISDEIIFNSAQFVPLFGSKAANSQQATFVVVPNGNTPVSAGEIASQVIAQVNNYFAIGNFSFGQTFYWSQLSNYITSNLGGLINAINLVPKAGNLRYGALEQITCNPYEIFINCATVSDVSVVNTLTNLNLRIS